MKISHSQRCFTTIYILNDLYVDETNSSNKQAQALYEKVGMIEEETVKHYIYYWND